MTAVDTLLLDLDAFFSEHLDARLTSPVACWTMMELVD
jgi:hypothetical protein